MIRELECIWMDEVGYIILVVKELCYYVMKLFIEVVCNIDKYCDCE